MCSDSPCECKKRPKKHTKTWHWISILCHCVTKGRSMGRGLPTSFQCRFPMFDSISRTAVIWRGELMVAYFLGPISILGSPYPMFSWFCRKTWKNYIHTFSCRPTYRPILHINLYKQMRFHISMVVCNVRSEIKTARAKAFSWASAKGHHVVAQTWKEQTTAIEMRKIGGRKEAIHQTFFPRAIAAVCKCKCQLNTSSLAGSCSSANLTI